MKNKKMIKLIIFVTILLVIAVVGTFYENNKVVRSFFDKYIFRKEQNENDLPQILVESNKNVYTYGYNNEIIILNNNKIISYTQYGNEKYSLDVEISTPIFASNGRYLAIAEKKGNKVYVLADDNIVWQKNLEGEIIDLKINQNGYLLVATTGNIYKQVIQTFNNKGKELFKNFISSTNIIDMDISPDNKHVAIAEVNCTGIMIRSNIKIISVDKAKNDEQDSIVLNKTGNDGDLIVNIKYLNKNNLGIIYDNHVEIIQEANTNTLNIDREDTLFMDLNNRFIKIVNTGDKAVLQIFGLNLELNKEFEIPEPKEIYVSDNIIALNLGNEIYFYNNSGWLIKKYNAEQEVNKLVLCNNIAGIVYNEKIELISL